ncbi:MAG TPA: gliding motility-associated C-terminal domain-containing protein, partial [Flavobacteriales bacterium]|nr:gliding motility-associated C-terminal domain-containing protein [Flavobacteriales bacterium]
NTTPPEDIGSSCHWVLGDGTSLDDCGAVAHVYQDPGWYPVQLTVTTPAGCTDALFVPKMILVEEAPQADFLISPDPGTVGNSTIFFTGLDEGNVSYGWTLDSVQHGHGIKDQQWFNDVLSSTHTICLDVHDRYGCADTVCQQFEIVVPAIFYSNAFTPDGDGINDKYYPSVRDVVPGEHLFQVFDRWGEVIFTSTTPNEGWDGTFKGGSILPQGVYVWRLETLPMYAADKVEVFGSVTLIK